MDTAVQCTRELDWSQLIPAHEWATYAEVLREAQRQSIPFAVGGGLAYSACSCRARNTKDIDIFIRMHDRDAMVAILDQLGFQDYFDQEEYQRHWIYRAYRDGVIVDLIWQMANERTSFDERWVASGRLISVGDVSFRVLPVEELIWSKLYVLQFDRTDWTDLLNILYAQGDRLDWKHLISRVGSDRRLLAGVVSVYRWLCPGRSANLPNWVWKSLGFSDEPSAAGPDVHENNVCLLDSRDWFGPAHNRLC